MTVNIYEMAQTWNNGATTFTAIKMDVTDTDSAAASLLLDLQVDGTSLFTVTKAGEINWPTEDLSIGPGAGSSLIVSSSGTPNFLFGGSSLRTIGTFEFSSSIYAGSDVILIRDAANTLAQRNSTNAQASRLYGTTDGGSNYRRLEIASTTAGVFSITPTGSGTGSSGNVLHISGLPTSNPGPGILWNNAGTPAIGT